MSAKKYIAWLGMAVVFSATSIAGLSIWKLPVEASSNPITVSNIADIAALPQVVDPYPPSPTAYPGSPTAYPAQPELPQSELPIWLLMLIFGFVLLLGSAAWPLLIARRRLVEDQEDEYEDRGW